MQIFLWLIFLLIIAIAIFAVQNSPASPVAVKFLLWNFETSLIYTVLGSVGSGILIVLFLWIPRAIRASLRTKNLKKEIELLQGEMKHHLEEARKEENKKRALKSDIRNNHEGKLRLFWEALKKFDAHHGFFLASAITFNFLICLIPLILLLLALVGTYLYGDREVFNQVQRYFENAFPSLDPRIMQTLMTIVRDRQIVGILGIAGLIWVSTWIFSSLRTALNVVFEVEKSRSMLRGLILDFSMVLLAGFFLIGSMVLTSVMTFFQDYRFAWFLDIGPIAQFVLNYLLPLFFTFGMSFLVYKIVPNKKVPLKPALQAALFFAVLWEVAKHFFAWYILYLGKLRFSMLYGSLSTLAIFFLWVYYSSSILLLGAEIAHLLEKQTQQHKP